MASRASSQVVAADFSVRGGVLSQGEDRRVLQELRRRSGRRPFAGIRSAMVQLAVGIVAACTVRPFPRGRVTMIQAGIHVGAGVVLGVAAGWWLGIGNSRCRSRTRWRGSIACCTAPCWWCCSPRRLVAPPGPAGPGAVLRFPAGLFGESGKPVRCERVLEPCADLHAGLRSAGDAGRGDGLRAPGTRVALTQALRSRRSQVTRFLAVFLQPAQHFHGLPARGVVQRIDLALVADHIEAAGGSRRAGTTPRSRRSRC